MNFFQVNRFGKGLACLFFFFSIISPAISLNYYWVGGSGNWSEHNTHWAKTSGGAVFHDQVPTSMDNVFFDANSGFAAGNNVVTIDQTIIYCMDMDWTGVQNMPVFNGSNDKQVWIYGSLKLFSGMDWAVNGSIHFLAFQSGKTIYSAGKVYTSSVTFEGVGGEWGFTDPFTTSQGASVAQYAGTLRTNGHNVGMGSFYSGGTALYLGSSTFLIKGGYFSMGSTTFLDAGTSHVIFTTGGNLSTNSAHFFHNVTFNMGGQVERASISGKLTFEDYGNYRSFSSSMVNEVEFQQFGSIDGGGMFGQAPFFNIATFLGNGNLTGNNDFNQITFSAGKTYIISAGSTQTISPLGNFIALGTGGFPIEIKSNQLGQQATLFKDGDPICLDFLYMTDMKASGTGFSYAGANSDDVNNNDGWIFAACPACFSAPPLAMPGIALNSITKVAAGGQAKLVIQNLPAGYEAVWFNADQTIELYSDVVNNFMPTVNADATYWGAIREVSTGCVSTAREVLVKVCPLAVPNLTNAAVPFSTAPIGLAPGIKYAHTFGGPSGQCGRMIVALPDSTYVMAGDGDTGCGDGDIILLKSDCSGQILWQRSFGGGWNERIQWAMDRSLIQTSDGGFLIVATTESWGAGYLDGYLIKTDADGIEQWTQTIGGTQNDYARTAYEMADGSFLIAGYTFSDIPPTTAINGDGYLAKVSNTGTVIWQKQYNITGWEDGYSAVELNNGNILFSGFFGLIKTDANGNLISSNPGVPGYSYILNKLSNGDILYAGRQFANADAYLWRLDANGDPIWPTQATISLPEENYVYAAVETATGGFVCAGEIKPGPNGDWDFWFFETDANGALIWQRSFGGAGADWATSMKKTVDGDYIASGLSFSYPTGCEFLTVKLDMIPDAQPVLDPLCITAVNVGGQASLILQNLPLGYEAVWFDVTQAIELYANSANLFQPTINNVVTFYGGYREISTGCMSSLIPVTICAEPVPVGPANQDFCFGVSPLIANLIPTGADIVWYNLPTGGLQLPPNSALNDGTHYFAARVGPSCESTRLDVLVSIINPPLPVGSCMQSFCVSDNPTIASLVPNGPGITWYNVPTGGVPLAPGMPLVNGANYYASQTTGGCESNMRLHVMVGVVTPAPGHVCIGGCSN